MRKKGEYNEVDFKKAYDLVRREIFYNIIIECGIPLKLVRLIKMCLNETYSRDRVGKNLSDIFPIRNGLKQGNALSSMLFNFALEYTNRRVQVNQDGLKLNGTHQLLVYAGDVNILGGSEHTIKKNAETLAVASKETGKAAVPLQAWSGPEGSKKLKFPDFMTKAQDVRKLRRLG